MHRRRVYTQPFAIMCWEQPCSYALTISLFRFLMSANPFSIFSIYLNADALMIIRQQLGRHPSHVFTYKGRPLRKASTRCWRKRLKRAGIEDFRWHDLRHTWASWHVQAGTPLNVLQELGGWADFSMVLRYAHLSSSHLMAYADNVSEKGAVTNLLQVTNAETLKSA